VEERFGPREIVDDALLRSLSQRSDAHGLAQLALHVGALAATGAAIALTRGSWWVAPTVLAHGIALTFLFTPLHETIHRTAFRSRWLNDVVAWVTGFVILLPPEWFRQFHFAHHRWTQDPARDPELSPPKPATIRAWLWYATGYSYWVELTKGLFAHAVGKVDEPYVSARTRPAVATEARLYLLAYAAVFAVAAIAGRLDLLFWYWILPVLIGQPFLRLYLLAEHTGCELSTDMLRNTRTTLTNVVVRRLAWNMPYHAEHHAFPAVPFHALPRLHDRLAPHLAVVAPGYCATTIEIYQGIAARHSPLMRNR
jgi:fatty acid desaturase